MPVIPGDPMSDTILMVDDDPYACNLTRIAMEEGNVIADFRTVGDGSELFDYLYHRGKYRDDPTSAPRPGLILLDLNMPRKDGREALSDLKADPALRQIPVVIMTTSYFEDDVRDTYAMGASSFITKPLSFDQLVETMQILSQYWFHLVQLPI